MPNLRKSECPSFLRLYPVYAISDYHATSPNIDFDESEIGDEDPFFDSIVGEALTEDDIIAAIDMARSEEMFIPMRDPVSTLAAMLEEELDAPLCFPALENQQSAIGSRRATANFDSGMRGRQPCDKGHKARRRRPHPKRLYNSR
jgi:hypothetical protein